MAVQFNEYTEGVIQINGTGAANTIRAVSIVENPDALELRRAATGRIQPSFSATAKVDPKITFETQEVGKILDLMAVGTHIKGVLIGTNVTLYWPKVDEIDRSTGSDHQVTTVNEGIVIPRSLRWSGENDSWMISCEVLSSYDGTNNPFVYSTASLPAVLDLQEAFIGGKLMVSGAHQEGWQSATLDFGFTGVQRHASGHMYPGRAHVQSGMPFWEIPHLNLALRSTWALKATKVTSVDMYLRRQEDDAPDRWPDTNAPPKHIRLSTVSGLIRMRQISGNNPTTGTVFIACDETPTAPPVAYTNGVDIP